MSKKISEQVLKAIEKAPNGILTLDILESLKLCDRDTLKTTLSRLNKKKEIIRLKRGVYSTNPIQNIFAVAQTIFGGYICFASALYLHQIITEMPYTIQVVTSNLSGTKNIGQYEIRACMLGERAIGFERHDDLVISSRAKTLFDSIYLPANSIEEKKLVESYRNVKLKTTEWKEFDSYVAKFTKGNKIKKFQEIKNRIRGK